MEDAAVFSAVVFRSDGAILTASSDRTVQLRRWAAGVNNTSPANPLVFPSPPVHIELAPGNERFAVVFGAAGNSIQLWHAPTTAQESELFTPAKPVREQPLRDFDRTGIIADKSRDDRRVMKFDTEDSLVVVDARSGAKISGPFHKESGYEGGGIFAARFDDTGRFIAIGEGADFRLGIGYARVWNADTGQPVTDPLVHTLAVTQVSFGDDGKRLLTVQSKLGSSLSTSRIWALPSGAPVSDRMPPEVDRFKIPDEALFAVLDRKHGRLTQYISEEAIAEIRDVAFPAGLNAPSWLPLLAELAGGRQLNADTGVVEPLADHWPKLQALRAQLESSGARDPFSLLGRWFLADPRQRTLSPYSALTVRSYLERCTATKDEACLDDAKRLAGSDPKPEAR
jgi:WD40 repeat protein